MTDASAEALSAIAQAGSPAFTVHAGATLTLMFDLAKRGELEKMRETLCAHAAIYPSDRHALIQATPAKVLNGYFYVCRQASFGAVQRWLKQTPDWADTLEHAVVEPARFAAICRAMAAAVGRAELG